MKPLTNADDPTRVEERFRAAWGSITPEQRRDWEEADRQEQLLALWFRAAFAVIAAVVIAVVLQ